MATREPLRETTGNSKSGTTRASAAPAKRGELVVNMGPLELREWQRRWKGILATATLYFDCVDNQSIARVEPTLRRFGAVIDRFFSVKVTHVVTSRSLEGKYPPGDVLQKAMSTADMKIWTYEKLLRFLGYMLQKPASQKTEEQQDKLAVMLRQEKALGPNDRDPTARREDYHYFKGPYILIWDPSSAYRPLMHKEYEKDGAPRLHITEGSKCPFQEDERKRKWVGDNASAHQPKALKTSATVNATTVNPQDLIRKPSGSADPRVRGHQVRITNSQTTAKRTENGVKRAAELRQKEIKALSRPKAEIRSTPVPQEQAVTSTGQPEPHMEASDQTKPTTAGQHARAVPTTVQPARTMVTTKTTSADQAKATAGQPTHSMTPTADQNRTTNDQFDQLKSANQTNTPSTSQSARTMVTTADQMKTTTANQTDRVKSVTTTTVAAADRTTTTGQSAQTVATAADQSKKSITDQTARTTAATTEQPERPKTITVFREDVRKSPDLPEKAQAQPADAHKMDDTQDSTEPAHRGIWDKPTNNNDQSHHHHQSKFDEIAASGIRPSMTSAAQSVVQSGTTDGGGNGLGAPTTHIASKEVNHLKKRVLSKLPPQKIQPAPSNVNKKEEKDPSEEKKKQGWCENCQQKFERLEDHIKTSRHFRYATDSTNFVELDHLLHSLRRQEKQIDKSSPRTPEAQLASSDPQTPPTHPLSPTPSARKKAKYLYVK